MCIIFVYAPDTADDASGGYRLIIASNRDEYYARPAQPLANWTEDNGKHSHKAATDDCGCGCAAHGGDDGDFILGGRDMEPGREGGTWLAIGNHGGRVRLAALLNLTGEPHTDRALGRGFLVNNYVSGDQTAAEYCEALLRNGLEYNGFNLLTVEIGADKSTADIRLCSKAPPTNQSWPHQQPLCFGNSPPQTPLAKVCAGRAKFERVCATSGSRQRDELLADLFALLGDRTACWPDAELGRRVSKWGRDHSSICVRMRDGTYGTRTNSVILIDADNRLDYYERTMRTCDPDGEWESTHISKQVRLYD